MMPKTDIKVQLAGRDGNAFAVLSRVTMALERAGHKELAREYQEEATDGDYDHLLATTAEYVHVE